MWLHVSWVTPAEMLTFTSKVSPIATSPAQLIPHPGTGIRLHVPYGGCYFPRQLFNLCKYIFLLRFLVIQWHSWGFSHWSGAHLADIKISLARGKSIGFEFHGQFKSSPEGLRLTMFQSQPGFPIEDGVNKLTITIATTMAMAMA